MQLSNVSRSPLHSFALDRLTERRWLKKPIFFISGASGSGKRTCAKNIHDLSFASEQSFFEYDCEKNHAATYESSFFGYSRGDFLGAFADDSGFLRSMAIGTLYISNFQKVALPLQKKIFTFLSENLRADLMWPSPSLIFSAENCASLDTSLAGLLSEFHVYCPSLFEQRQNFDRIFHALLEKICMWQRKSILEIAENFAELFENYHWPQNFHELEQALNEVVARDQDRILSLGDCSLALIAKLTGKSVQAPSLKTAKISSVNRFFVRSGLVESGNSENIFMA